MLSFLTLTKEFKNQHKFNHILTMYQSQMRISRKQPNNISGKSNSSSVHSIQRTKRLINGLHSLNNAHYQLFKVAESVHNRYKSRYGLRLLLQPKDITQGSLGDCYFLSALAAIVHLYPEFIYRLFVIDKNPSHISGVKLFIQGIWKTIIVDGIFPLNSKGQLTAAQPHHK